MGGGHGQKWHSKSRLAKGMLGTVGSIGPGPQLFVSGSLGGGSEAVSIAGFASLTSTSG